MNDIKRGIDETPPQFCSTCETDKYLKLKTVSHEFDIDGKKSMCNYEVFVCEKCGEYVSSPEMNERILEDVKNQRAKD